MFFGLENYSYYSHIIIIDADSTCTLAINLSITRHVVYSFFGMFNSYIALIILITQQCD